MADEINRDELAAWPMYALVDYENSGWLLVRCRSLLSFGSLFENTANQHEAEREEACPNRRNATQLYCTTTSGYQTLDEQLQAATSSSSIHQNGGGKFNECEARPRAHRSSTFSTSDAARNGSGPGNLASWPNKSTAKEQGRRQRQDQDRHRERDGRPKAKRLLWWHLIEPVNYGKSAEPNGGQVRAEAVERRANGDVMDLQLDSLYQARVMKLCHEITRAVSSFLVLKSGDEFRLGQSKNRNKTTANQKTSPRPSVDLADDHSAGLSKLPVSAEAARLRRLSWRRKPAEPSWRHGKVGPVRKLVRAETFDSGRPRQPNELAAIGADKHERVENKTKFRRRIDIWLDQFDGHKLQEAKWSGEPEARGRYGESLVHALLVNHTNEHLLLLVLILKLYPNLLDDIHKSDKFFGLNCLHLAIAYGNQRLLEHLLELASLREQDQKGRQMPLVEQRVTGSLFRSPLSLTGTSEKVPPRPIPRFWCDEQKHWPAANGFEHLILNDRIKRMTDFAPNSMEQLGSTSTTANGHGANNSEQTIYFGQTPLSWSVAFESREMFELLASKGRANVLESGDHQDNNCLHQLIINNQKNWTRFLLKFSPPLANQFNSMQLTPFLLACHLGRVELFNELLELSAVEFWTYSSVKCCAYPLASLDPIVMPPASHTERPVAPSQNEVKSAVSVILESKRSSDQQKAALLSTGVIKKLLEEKWNIFARRLFYTDLILTLLQLILMTFACFIRPARVKSNYLQELEALADNGNLSPRNYPADYLKLLTLTGPRTNKLDLLRNACEILIVTISLARLWAVLLEWARYKNLSLQFTYNPLVANLALANLLIILCLPIRLVGFCLRHFSVVCSASGTKWCNSEQRQKLTETASALHQLDQFEDFLLILASPLLWSSLLFFVAAFHVTGPFVAMIKYMLMKDAKQFSLIYLIFLCSFAQSIFFTNYDQQSSSELELASSGTATGSGNRTLEPVRAGGPHQPSLSTEQTQNEFWLLADWLSTIVAKYLQLWLELFKMTLGVYEFQPFRQSLLSRGLLMLFIQLIPILFNMLIAMMNNTYSLVISQSERAWSFQWARTLFALERRLSNEEKLYYLKKYAINLSTNTTPVTETSGETDARVGAGSRTGSITLSAGKFEQDQTNARQQDEDEQFVPGLMIIKRTECTKAELRRRLVGMWQKSTRRVMENIMEGSRQ